MLLSSLLFTIAGLVRYHVLLSLWLFFFFFFFFFLFYSFLFTTCCYHYSWLGYKTIARLVIKLGYVVIIIAVCFCCCCFTTCCYHYSWLDQVPRVVIIIVITVFGLVRQLPAVGGRQEPGGERQAAGLHQRPGSGTRRHHLLHLLLHQVEAFPAAQHHL